MDNDTKVRRVDEFGRIVIPTEIRKSLGWTAGTELSVFEKDGTVIFKLAEKSQAE